MNNNESVQVDHTALDQYREVMGEEADEFILEIVQSFVDEAQNMVNKIADHYKAGGVEAFHIGVHTMKSNLRLVGASPSSEKFEALENMSSIDLQQINAGMIQAATEEVLLVCAELRKQYPDANG